jgi:autotransporter-associated beta strand protein
VACSYKAPLSRCPAGGARDVQISGPITGNGQMIKHGAARLLYLGATTNTYTGTTTVNAGTLMLSRSSVDGCIRGNLVIGDGTGVGAVGIFADEQITNVGVTR